jgi:hypothetical protein
LELDPTEIYEYEVLIFDQQRGRELVAAIELVSSANKESTREPAGVCFQMCCLVAKEDLRLNRRFSNGKTLQSILRSAGRLLSKRSCIYPSPASDLCRYLPQSQSGDTITVRIVGVSDGCWQEVACLTDMARQRSRNIFGLGNIVLSNMQCITTSLMLGTAPFENGLIKKCDMHEWNFVL